MEALREAQAVPYLSLPSAAIPIPQGEILTRKAVFTLAQVPGCAPRGARVSPFPFPLLTSSATVVGSHTDRQFSMACPAARLMPHLGSLGNSLLGQFSEENL